MTHQHWSSAVHFEWMGSNLSSFLLVLNFYVCGLGDFWRFCTTPLLIFKLVFRKSETFSGIKPLERRVEEAKSDANDLYRNWKPQLCLQVHFAQPLMVNAFNLSGQSSCICLIQHTRLAKLNVSPLPLALIETTICCIPADLSIDRNCFQITWHHHSLDDKWSRRINIETHCSVFQFPFAEPKLDSPSAHGEVFVLVVSCMGWILQNIFNCELRLICCLEKNWKCRDEERAGDLFCDSEELPTKWQSDFNCKLFSIHPFRTCVIWREIQHQRLRSIPGKISKPPRNEERLRTVGIRVDGISGVGHKSLCVQITWHWKELSHIRTTVEAVYEVHMREIVCSIGEAIMSFLFPIIATPSFSILLTFEKQLLMRCGVALALRNWHWAWRQIRLS